MSVSYAARWPVAVPAKCAHMCGCCRSVCIGAHGRAFDAPTLLLAERSIGAPASRQSIGGESPEVQEDDLLLLPFTLKGDDARRAGWTFYVRPSSAP